VSDDNVIPLFRNTPAADTDTDDGHKVAEWIEEHMQDFIFWVNQMDRAEDIAEFRNCMARVKRIVRGWPKP
jgi:hypothetical protein